MEIRTAETEEDLISCRLPLLAFRAHLDADKYLDTMRAVINDGYQLAFITEDDGEAAAIVGYRYINMLRTGKTIYIDDLFVLPEHRGKGYAINLLAHIRKIAETNQVKQVHLDSGYQLNPAHRLYLNQGFILNCLHFAYTV